MESKLVTFTLNGVEFGIDLSKVDVIEEPLKISPVLGAPDYIEGLVDLRGQIYTIFNGRRIFGFEQLDTEKKSRILMLNVLHNPIGIRVDAVNNILNIDKAEIQYTPDSLSIAHTEYITGSIQANDNTILLFDAEKLISLPPSHTNNM